ncbi:MAG TPA: hypothetical protein VFA43_24995 [Gemmatimonadaceae bacterium]|nr:hypothetical protein [Gemmatimonadaceae bacterium]
MHADYSDDPGRAAVQRLATSHVRVETAENGRGTQGSKFVRDLTDFLRQLNHDLYSGIPEAERVVRAPSGREEKIVPGEWRASNVKIGHHIPLRPEAVAAFMRRFDEVYEVKALGKAAAAGSPRGRKK